jgi:hypothetical protein
VRPPVEAAALLLDPGPPEVHPHPGGPGRLDGVEGTGRFGLGQGVERPTEGEAGEVTDARRRGVGGASTGDGEWTERGQGDERDQGGESEAEAMHDVSRLR